MLEIALQYDALDPGRVACLEVAPRRIQIVHERWKDKLPSLSGAAGGVKGEEDTFLMLGTHEVRGNLGVCPALSRWMGEELSKEALLDKERRKAREERALAAPKK